MYEYVAVVRSVGDDGAFRADIDLGFGVWLRGQVLATGEAGDVPPPGTEVLLKCRKESGRRFSATVLIVADAEQEQPPHIEVTRGLVWKRLPNPRPPAGD